jgi:hypothetical protein
LENGNAKRLRGEITLEIIHCGTIAESPELSYLQQIFLVFKVITRRDYQDFARLESAKFEKNN